MHYLKCVLLKAFHCCLIFCSTVFIILISTSKFIDTICYCLFFSAVIKQCIRKCPCGHPSDLIMIFFIANHLTISIFFADYDNPAILFNRCLYLRKTSIRINVHPISYCCIHIFIIRVNYKSIKRKPAKTRFLSAFILSVNTFSTDSVCLYT